MYLATMFTIFTLGLSTDNALQAKEVKQVNQSNQVNQTNQANQTNQITQTTFKVAIVDVDAVVSKSSAVKALKQEQAKKLQELAKWVEVAKKDVEKQSSEENKKKLAKKYDAEFIKKRTEIQKTYAQKLQQIDEDISKIIAKEAQKQNYSLVLPKSNTLLGGDDITKAIIKAVE